MSTLTPDTSLTLKRRWDLYTITEENIAAVADLVAGALYANDETGETIIFARKRSVYVVGQTLALFSEGDITQITLLWNDHQVNDFLNEQFELGWSEVTA